MLYQYDTVAVEKQQSTCVDQLKVGRKNSELVISLNQTLQCYNDVTLMVSGVPTTADLVHLVRLHVPHLFDTD